MTVKLSISVPDDVAAYLQGRGNASAAVTEAVRRVLPEARHARQREAARAYGEHLRRRTAQQTEDDNALIETSTPPRTNSAMRFIRDLQLKCAQVSRLESRSIPRQYSRFWSHIYSSLDGLGWAG